MDELRLQVVQPFMCFGVGGAEGVCGGQWNKSLTGPFVHVSDITGKYDLCEWFDRGSHLKGQS